MDIYTATEQAYKNGYEDGKKAAAEKKASIYDLYEMCNYYTCEKNSCTECPLYNYTCDPTLADNIDTINDLTLKWKKEHEEKKDETN